MIKIETELNDWLVTYITDTINNLEANEPVGFNEWAKSFKKEEAQFVVNMEFTNDWGYEKREEITEEEATEYAHSLIQRIVNNWYL